MIEVQVLFLREEGGSNYKEISNSLGISVYHVKKILVACESAGVTFASAQQLTEEELSKILHRNDKKKCVSLIPLDCHRWYTRYANMEHPNLLYLWTKESFGSRLMPASARTATSRKPPTRHR